MLDPACLGEFETLDALAPTLVQIFAQEVGPRFLSWSDANAKAFGAGSMQTELTMYGRPYYQKTFKYPAQGLAELRRKFAQCSGERRLTEFLDATDCSQYLAYG